MNGCSTVTSSPQAAAIDAVSARRWRERHQSSVTLRPHHSGSSDSRASASLVRRGGVRRQPGQRLDVPASLARHVARVEPARLPRSEVRVAAACVGSANSRATTWAPELEQLVPAHPRDEGSPARVRNEQPAEMAVRLATMARSGAAAARRPDRRGPAHRSPRREPSPRDPGDAPPSPARRSRPRPRSRETGRSQGWAEGARDGARHASLPPAGPPSPSPRRRRRRTARAGAPAPAPAPGRCEARPGRRV